MSLSQCFHVNNEQSKVIAIAIEIETIYIVTLLFVTNLLIYYLLFTITITITLHDAKGEDFMSTGTYEYRTSTDTNTET